jgi:hypothetical protein
MLIQAKKYSFFFFSIRPIRSNLVSQNMNKVFVFLTLFSQVNALQGTYDSLLISGKEDTEREQIGGIINALCSFPTYHNFTVVAKTITVNNESGDNEDQHNDIYVQEIKTLVESLSGYKVIDVDVKPRGSKFIRVSFGVTVESVSILSSIYEGLGALERTIMRY